MSRNLLTLLMLPLTAATLWADPRSDALAVLDAGIAAQGGKTALARTTTFERSGSGALILPSGKQEFTDTVQGQLPERWRITIEHDKRVKITMAFNDKAGWQAVNGDMVPMQGEKLEELREEAYVLLLTALVPLTGEGYTLTPVAATERDGRTCVGVKVVSKGHYDATLWFDRETKLLSEIEKEARQASVRITKVYRYAIYKEFATIKMPTRITELIGTRVVTEVTIKEYRFPEKLDPAMFSKP